MKERNRLIIQQTRFRPRSTSQEKKLRYNLPLTVDLRGRDFKSHLKQVSKVIFKMQDLQFLLNRRFYDILPQVSTPPAATELFCGSQGQVNIR